MKKKIGKFEMIIGDKGIIIIDYRHKPPRKCGTLSWKNIMSLIEEEFTSPSFYPTGPF